MVSNSITILNKGSFLMNKKLLETRISKLENLIKSNNKNKRKFENDDWDYESFDFEELVSEHGLDFLMDSYPDNVPISMDEFNDFETDPYEAVRKTFNGRRYGLRDCFNPNDEWFVYDGYGNLVSIPDLNKYLEDFIDEYELYQWCKDNNLID